MEEQMQTETSKVKSAIARKYKLSGDMHFLFFSILVSTTVEQIIDWYWEIDNIMSEFYISEFIDS